MANVLTGNVWTVDTIGYLSTTPVKIRKITLWPNTAGDLATFTCADFGSANTRDAQVDHQVAISSSVITLSGHFTSSLAVIGDGFEITTSDTGASIGRYFITVVNSNDAITVSGPTAPTNDTDVIINWKTYAGRLVANLKSEATASTKVPMEIDFGEGMWVPSLACSVISASNDLCYVTIA
jgi:hypothetical protein